MKLVHHKNLTLKRWQALSLAEQLANVGSEVGRTIGWKNKGDRHYADLAMERALELLDLTIADPKNIGRLKEILRTREMLVDWYYFDNQYASADALWEQYFLGFNFMARQKHPRGVSPGV